MWIRIENRFGNTSIHKYMDGLNIDKFMQYISCICRYVLDTDLDTKVDIDDFMQKISHNW